MAILVKIKRCQLTYDLIKDIFFFFYVRRRGFYHLKTIILLLFLIFAEKCVPN